MPSINCISLESKRSSYRPEIDGLRALAVISVIINHFNKDILPSGYLGVDIFFVISGFVITSSLANRSSRNLGDFLLGFYNRRIKRLVPALVLCVAITSLLICFFNPDPGTSLKTGITALFGLSNLYLLKQSTDYFATSTELNVFTHTWSLGVEEQFYFLFPFLVWFTGFSRLTVKGPRNLFLVIGSFSVASLLSFIALYYSNQPAAYFLMPTRFWEMGVGCLLFLSLRKANYFGNTFVPPPPLLVLVSIIAVLFIPLRFAVLATITVVFLTAILIVNLRPGTIPYQLFTRKQVIYIGLISYSLYLWHWSVLSLSRWTIGVHWWSVPIQLSLMFFFAMLSYRYVECPLRRAEWSELRWRSICYGLGLSTTLAWMVNSINLNFKDKIFSVFHPPRLREALYTEKSYVFEKPEINTIKCSLSHLSSGKISDLVRQCTLNPTRRQQKIFFIGDSQSNHLKGLGGLLNSKLGLGVQMLSVPSTPYPGVRYEAINGETLSLNKARISLQRNIVNFSIKLAKPRDVFVLSGRYTAYFGDLRIPLHQRDLMIQRYSSFNNRKITPNTALEEWLIQLDDLLGKLKNKDIQVVLFLPFPEFPYSGAKCLSFWSIFQDKNDCSFNRKKLLEIRSLFIKKISIVESKYQNFYLYDPFPTLCPIQKRCYSLDNQGRLLYRDATHLSTYGSRLLYDSFSRFLYDTKLLSSE